MFKSTIGRFRLSGFIEGASLLVLLFIAMPLKYMAGVPEAVTIVGSLHGFFFVIYVLAIGYTTLKIRWHFKWAAGALAVAFIPFGNLVLDRYIKRSFPSQ
jgi:integral membrane protein